MKRPRKIPNFSHTQHIQVVNNRYKIQKSRRPQNNVVLIRRDRIERDKPNQNFNASFIPSTQLQVNQNLNALLFTPQPLIPPLIPVNQYLNALFIPPAQIQDNPSNLIDFSRDCGNYDYNPLNFGNFCDPNESTNNSQNIIELWCSQVLDQYKDVVTEAEMDSQRKKMGEAWKSNVISTSILEYNDINTRCSYIRTDLPLRAHFVSELCENFLFSIFKNNQMVNIVSVGCGPGTELVGIMNYLIQAHQEAQAESETSWSTIPMVRFLLADRANGWEDVIRKFEGAIRSPLNDPNYNSNDFIFEKSFFNFNLTDPTTLHLLSRLPTARTSHLFTFSLIFSEVIKEGDAAMSTAMMNIKGLFDNAQPQSHFVFIDVDHEKVRNVLQNQLDSRVFFPENSIKVPGALNFSLPTPNNDCSSYINNNNNNSNIQRRNVMQSGSLFFLLYVKL